MVVSVADAPAERTDDGLDARTILCTSLHYDWGNHFVINVNLERMKYRVGRFKLFLLFGPILNLLNINSVKPSHRNQQN